ncbi:protein of unknown function [uncultured Sphingopyxis sp.]|uniref:Uncharacterized protein n=1 Tax=uncultured Sphingopyxis sp. TaxID=310581 RepID=A0A1Y5PVL8_9SPHN|nr:protein of unknown function [uncultured Sphingopyxis sp.]
MSFGAAMFSGGTGFAIVLGLSSPINPPSEPPGERERWKLGTVRFVFGKISIFRMDVHHVRMVSLERQGRVFTAGI